jgi:CRP-like cAMP-binding protein
VFEGCSEQFIVALTSLLKTVAVPAHTVIFSAGDPGDALYIVHSGVLNVLVRTVKVREMRKGVCFGELSVFSDMPRTATIMSATYSILYRLSRFHCERVLEGYPICAALVRSHVQRMIIGSASVSSNSSSTTDSSRFGAKVGSKLSYIGKSIKKNFSTASSVKRSVVLPTLDRSDIDEEGSGRSHGGANVAVTKGESAPASSRGGSDAADETLDRTMTVSHHLVKYYDQADTKRPGDNHLNVHCRFMDIWTRILPKKCIDADSVFRKRWLMLLQVRVDPLCDLEDLLVYLDCDTNTVAPLQINLLYYWMIVPMQLVFPLWQRPSPIFITLDVIMDAGLLVDLVLNFSLSFTVDAEKIMDPRRSAHRYLRRGFLVDLLCMLPYMALHTAISTNYGVLRLPRLGR